MATFIAIGFLARLAGLGFVALVDTAFFDAEAFVLVTFAFVVEDLDMHVPISIVCLGHGVGMDVLPNMVDLSTKAGIHRQVWILMHQTSKMEKSAVQGENFLNTFLNTPLNPRRAQQYGDSRHLPVLVGV